MATSLPATSLEETSRSTIRASDES
jgi:hypothetical protein